MSESNPAGLLRYNQPTSEVNSTFTSAAQHTPTRTNEQTNPPPLTTNNKHRSLSLHGNKTVMGSIGIPIKLLNEAQVRVLLFPSLLPPPPKNIYISKIIEQCTDANVQGHVCTLELTSGQIFRGKLIEGMSRRRPSPPL